MRGLRLSLAIPPDRHENKGIRKRGPSLQSAFNLLGGRGRWVSVSSRPAWSTEQVPGQVSEKPCHKKRKKKKEKNIKKKKRG